MAEAAPWRAAASLPMLQARAWLLAEIRGFFAELGVLEVETPVCSRFGTTDPAIESLRTRYTGPGAAGGVSLYLQTSPEFPMKRLLAAGSGPIYQICRVFRDAELGRRHNPEFTLLEWYRPGLDHQSLMDEVSALVARLLSDSRPEERLSYRQVFQRHLRIDPHTARVETLQRCAMQQGIAGAEGLGQENRDAWLDLLLSHLIEPHLGRGRLSYVYDYPASQAALSRVRPGDPPLAERFELYLEGMEIANGFHELADAAEQRRRFEADNATRRARGLARVAMDRHLLAALDAGLPDCAGVALGIDRLLMVLSGRSDIHQVLAFPFASA
jgi:lysyl-tRNA synthetase class 2